MTPNYKEFEMKTIVEPDGVTCEIPDCARCGKLCPLGRLVEVADGADYVLCPDCMAILEIVGWCPCPECAYWDRVEAAMLAREGAGREAA